jgi:hypothetical protein
VLHAHAHVAVELSVLAINTLFKYGLMYLIYYTYVTCASNGNKLSCILLLQLDVLSEKNEIYFGVYDNYLK